MRCGIRPPMTCIPAGPRSKQESVCAVCDCTADGWSSVIHCDSATSCVSCVTMALILNDCCLIRSLGGSAVCTQLRLPVWVTVYQLKRILQPDAYQWLISRALCWWVRVSRSAPPIRFTRVKGFLPPHTKRNIHCQMFCPIGPVHVRSVQVLAPQ